MNSFRRGSIFLLGTWVIPRQVSKFVYPTPPKFAEIFSTYLSPQNMTTKIFYTIWVAENFFRVIFWGDKCMEKISANLGGVGYATLLTWREITLLAYYSMTKIYSTLRFQSFIMIKCTLNHRDQTNKIKHALKYRDNTFQVVSFEHFLCKI